MRQTSWCLLAGLVACSSEQMPPPPPTPPSVFLVAPESNVVGLSFKVRVNVTGCEKVDQLQIEQNGKVFKTAVFRGANTEIEVLPGDIATFYGALGIAADLTLRARAICSDGRENRSSPVGIKFFPVASVVPPSAMQSIILPDSFVATGGVAGAPVNFIGCANTTAGLSLVRLDQAGEIKGINQALPFGCDYYATISERLAGGLRWLYQPGKGAFAFDDQSMNVTGGILGEDFAVFAAGPDGDAVVWNSMTGPGAPSTFKIKRNMGTAMGPNIAWGANVPGIVNGQPAFDLSSGLLLVPSWRVPFASMEGTQTIQYVNYMTGAVTGQLALVTQRFGMFEPQNPPQVAFSPDGRTIYIPVPVQGNDLQSAVIACGTQGGGAGCTPRWRSPNLEGLVRYIIPFAGGTKVAAISDNKVWFLDESSTVGAGQLLGPAGLPTALSGQLTVSGAQPGLGSDFYLLGGAPFATEIIAFDTPSNGEVWRYSFEGGNTAQNAITMAVDDSGTAWLRIGLNQVRPLSLTEYRNVRGATVPPP